MPWPPQLLDLKIDLGVGDTRDDVVLQTVLDAAVEWVANARRSSFNFAGTPASLLPAPTANIVLGTLRLAGRWHSRRRSPDGLVDMGELGSSRISSYDPDIERLLSVGRYRKAVVA